MSIKELRKRMAEVEKEYKDDDDWELLHSAQDSLLLGYINDKEVTDIFNRTPKWYS